MPLFLQPDFTSLQASFAYWSPTVQSVLLDARVDAERTNYEAPRLLPWLDLLDRESQGVEVGVLASGSESWQIRFFSGLRWSQYKDQGSDPFRRDHTVNVGAQWMLRSWVGEEEDIPVHVSLGVEGTVNRSNSRRPEYDALSVTSDVFTALPWWGLSARAVSLLTWKTYVHQTEFARLVPGEEADNASVVHLDLIRPMASNLTATLRLGWTRAETDIGNSYYRRFGTSLLFDFRPIGR